MAAIFVVEAPGQITRVFRSRRPTVVLGRAETADLILPNISVSRQHASLEGAVLTPLEDSNPVLVNGQPLTAPASLRHGDEVRLGKYRLVYYAAEQLDLLQQVELEALPPHTGRAPSGDTNNSAATYAISAELQQRLLRQEQLREGAALVGADGTRWPLGGDPTIGPGGDIPAAVWPLRAPVVQVRWEGQAHTLARLGWLGKVQVNGSAVKTHTLRPGDQIQVGTARFTYTL